VPGSYYVQVAAYSDSVRAQQIQSELQAIGPVQVTELISSEGALFRVRLGPIAGRDEAETALVQVISSGHADAHLIVSHPVQAGLVQN
jgi:cell division septation protein DedD